MDIKRNVLLNPGPATTTDSVKMAQVIPDICPREQEFGDVMEFVAKGLTEFVGALDKYTTVIFGGSGTAAVESMLSSVVGEGSVLIVNNGAYGKRMCDIASVYGMNYIEFDSSAIAAIDMCKLEQVIMDNKEKLTHLAV
ncbi:MAG: 2-aminoethylphosphonate--pyruvate aminotransferase, partial [Clostridium sp.]